MIKIEMEFATGEQARQELMNLLGINGTVTISGENLQTAIDRPKMEVIADKAEETAPAAEAPKKRRTKAEVEAEKETKAEEAPVEETKAGESPVEETPVEEAAEGEVTLVDLQKLAVELQRVGKRELCRASLQEIASAEKISAADKKFYPQLLEAFTKLLK